MAIHLHLTVSNCTSYGGAGTLKVAVMALTSVSMTHLTAAQVVTTNPQPSSYAAPPSTTPTQASPSQAPPAPKSNNTSSSIHNHSSDPLQPNSDPGQETPFTPATQIAATPPHYPPQPGLSSLQEIAQLPASPVNTPSSPNSTDEATIV
jgi:hypothetical protein